MLRRHAVLIAILFLLPTAAFASCGAESCPMDATGRWAHSPFTFNVSFQYIDQDQPRVGSDDASVGEIPSEHEEVRTVNRTTTFSAAYQGIPSWYFGASLPYTDRYHEHIDTEGTEPETERWTYSGIGDMEFSVARSFGGGEKRSRQFASLGVKAPTGDTDVSVDGGEQPEPNARPGTGSWDLLAGLGAEWRLTATGLHQERNWLTLRLSATGRLNGTGTDDYKVGPELQLHGGADYPVSHVLGLLGQINYRYRGEDEVGSSGVPEDDTGGSVLYLSPGLRVATGHQTSLYGLVQFPVYQNVNGIQIVSDVNFYFGVTNAIF